VKLDATRAKRLGPDLDRIAGTSPDKGAELDALAKMPAPQRMAVIDRAALRCNQCRPRVNAEP
jgi:ParB family chromosome partitioning protein